MGDVASAVAVQRLSPQQKTVLDLIDRQKSQIEAALPRHIGLDRFHRVVLTEVRRNPKLLECEPMSLLGGLMLSAQLGLEMGPLGQAYLVPFRNNRRGVTEATFIMGYQGMIDLARRSGQVASIQAFPVFENDHFEYSFGLHPNIEHKPAEGDRGQLTHVYATVHYKDGGYNFEVLTRADVEKYRARSRAKDSGPWQTDYEAMALKTAIRRLWRWLPKSPEVQHVATLDEQTVDTIAPLGDVVDTVLLGGGEEIVDAEEDEDGEDEAPLALTEDEAWEEITDTLANGPPDGSKADLLAAVDRLRVLYRHVGLEVPGFPMDVTERTSKDAVTQAVTEFWEAARQSYSAGPKENGD